MGRVGLGGDEGGEENSNRPGVEPECAVEGDTEFIGKDCLRVTGRCPSPDYPVFGRPVCSKEIV